MALELAAIFFFMDSDNELVLGRPKDTWTTAVSITHLKYLLIAAI